MLMEVGLDGIILSLSGDISSYTEQEILGFGENLPAIEQRIEFTDFLESSTQYSYPFFRISDEKLDFISIPASPPLEIYCAKSQRGNDLYSDDFFEICTSIGSVSESSVSIEHFIDHWTFPTGSTYFKEVKRLVPGVSYKYENGKVVSFQNGQKTREVTKATDAQIYQGFKDGIDNTISMQADKLNNGLFLSGGVDSVLLGMVMQKLDIPFKGYTSIVTPAFNSSDEDNYDSQLISKKLGWEHETISNNLDDLSIDYIDDVLFSMPMSSHICFHFISLVAKMKEDGLSVGFSGQNMDSLYNLGPTSRLSFNMSSMADTLRRSFLTDQYFSSMKNVLGGNWLENLIWKSLGSIGKTAYNSFKGGGYCQPKNSEQLVHNYCHSNDYIVFTNAKEKAMGNSDACHKPILPQNVRGELLQYKINNFLMTGAPQSIYQSGRVKEFDVMLPYSSEIMVDVFKQFSMGYKDILQPKRYVYQYIKELSGQSYDQLLQGRKTSAEMSYHNWSVLALEKSKFGQSLVNYVGDLDRPKGFTDAQMLQRYLAHYWKKKIFSKLAELNVEIL